jgi:hypothetical protein
MVTVTQHQSEAGLRTEDGLAPPREASRLAGLFGHPAGRTAASVAMRLDGASDLFHVAVLDDRNEALLALGSYPEEDIVAEWRALGAATGLPLKIQLPNGAVMEPYPQLGRVLLGSTRGRRRCGLLNHRRPRFLTRRKTARFPLRPQVHREAELGGETR